MGDTVWTFGGYIPVTHASNTTTVSTATANIGTTVEVFTGPGFTWGELPPDPEGLAGVREPRRPIVPSDSEARR